MASRLHDSILWLLHACAILRNRAYNFQEQQGGALTKTAPEKHSFAEAFAMQQHEHGIYIHDTTPLYDENSDHAWTQTKMSRAGFKPESKQDAKLFRLRQEIWMHCSLLENTRSRRDSSALLSSRLLLPRPKFMASPLVSVSPCVCCQSNFSQRLRNSPDLIFIFAAWCLIWLWTELRRLQKSRGLQKCFAAFLVWDWLQDSFAVVKLILSFVCCEAWQLGISSLRKVI